MNSSWKHRCAVGAAAAALALILSGAFLTSSEGQPTASPLLQMPPAGEELHRLASELISLLAAVFCLWLIFSERITLLRVTASVTLLIWLSEAGVGIGMGDAPAAAAAVVHAFLAQLLMAATVVLALLTSSSWQSSSESPQETSSSFRWPARIIVVLILLQVLLGDAYRHQGMGVISHILNAMIVALAVFVVGMILTRKSSEPSILRSSAVALMIITGIQVMLGFAAFIMLLMMNVTHVAVVVISVAHVATGALTLAASAAFVMAAERSGKLPPKAKA